MVYKHGLAPGVPDRLEFDDGTTVSLPQGNDYAWLLGQRTLEVREQWPSLHTPEALAEAIEKNERHIAAMHAALAKALPKVLAQLVERQAQP